MTARHATQAKPLSNSCQTAAKPGQPTCAGASRARTVGSDAVRARNEVCKRGVDAARHPPAGPRRQLHQLHNRHRLICGPVRELRMHGAAVELDGQAAERPALCAAQAVSALPAQHAALHAACTNLVVLGGGLGVAEAIGGLLSSVDPGDAKSTHTRRAGCQALCGCSLRALMQHSPDRQVVVRQLRDVDSVPERCRTERVSTEPGQHEQSATTQRASETRAEQRPSSSRWCCLHRSRPAACWRSSETRPRHPAPTEDALLRVMEHAYPTLANIPHQRPTMLCRTHRVCIVRIADVTRRRVPVSCTARAGLSATHRHVEADAQRRGTNMCASASLLSHRHRSRRACSLPPQRRPASAMRCRLQLRER